MRFLRRGPSLKIRPSRIDVMSNRRKILFQDGRANAAAMWIVEFCQRRNSNSWKPFKMSDLQAYYRSVGLFPEDTLPLGKLVTGGYISVERGRCTVTPRFVAHCYAASPA